MEAGLTAALPENHQEVINKMKNEIKTTAHSTYRCQYRIAHLQHLSGSYKGNLDVTAPLSLAPDM